MIPKILHAVWVGPGGLPDKDRRNIEGWHRILPGWDIRIWGNRDLDLRHRYLREAFGARAWNRVSDFQRMAVLAEHGGVYLDTDVELLKPLDALLARPAFLGAQHALDHSPYNLLNGAVIGCVPGHWLPTLARDTLGARWRGWQDVGEACGPPLVTELVGARGGLGASQAVQQVDDVTVFPPRYFYPYFWGETFAEDLVTPETFAIHHWADSWKPPQPWRRRKRRAYQLLGQHFPSLALALTRAATSRAPLRGA